MTLYDDHGRRYSPYYGGRVQGSSISSGPFGLLEHHELTPHEVYAVYDIPQGTRLSRVVTGQTLPVHASF